MAPATLPYLEVQDPFLAQSHRSLGLVVDFSCSSAVLRVQWEEGCFHKAAVVTIKPQDNPQLLQHKLEVLLLVGRALLPLQQPLRVQTTNWPKKNWKRSSLINLCWVKYLNTLLQKSFVNKYCTNYYIISSCRRSLFSFQEHNAFQFTILDAWSCCLLHGICQVWELTVSRHVSIGGI